MIVKFRTGTPSRVSMDGMCIDCKTFSKHNSRTKYVSYCCCRTKYVSYCWKSRRAMIHRIVHYETCAKIFLKKSGIPFIEDPGLRILYDLGSCIFICSWDLIDIRSCSGSIVVVSMGSRILDRRDVIGSYGSKVMLLL